MIGLLALGALGPVLARLAAADDARGVLVSASFLAAGGLGAAAELALIGTRPVAISGVLCECGLRAEEIMSRLMVMNVVVSIEMWLISGALLSAAVGLIAAAGLGPEAGMPAAWRWLVIGTTAAAALAALIPHFSMLLRDSLDIHLFPFDLLPVGLVVGILVPAWVLWLASRSRDVMAQGRRPL